MIAARLVLLAALAAPGGAVAFTNVAVGARLDPEEMPTLDGGKAALLSPTAEANVFIFFRPQQEHSTETLKAMAACEKEFQARPVHWVAVVSSRWDAADIRKVVQETGIRMPVLVDQDDRLYGKLGIRLHPVVGVADGQYRLLAYEPFMKVNYCDRIRARIQLALKDITEDQARKVDAPDKATMPGDVEGAALARRVKMGRMFLGSKQWDKAEAEARTVLEKDPRNVGALVLLGDALAGKGDCPAAVERYAAALAIDPASAGASAGKKSCTAAR